MRADCGNLK
jgi:hypothetical protein